jgi:hypothetical protein
MNFTLEFSYIWKILSLFIRDILLRYRKTHWTEAHRWSNNRISYEPPEGSWIARTLWKIFLCRKDGYIANSEEFQYILLKLIYIQFWIFSYSKWCSLVSNNNLQEFGKYYSWFLFSFGTLLIPKSFIKDIIEILFSKLHTIAKTLFKNSLDDKNVFWILFK